MPPWRRQQRKNRGAYRVRRERNSEKMISSYITNQWPQQLRRLSNENKRTERTEARRGAVINQTDKNHRDASNVDRCLIRYRLN